MSLISCHECKAQISSEAATCPQCGVKQKKKTSTLTWIIGGILVFAIGKSIFSGPSTLSQDIASPPPDPVKEANFQKVVAAAKWAKRTAKDPSSFQLEYAGMTSSGTVCLEFRAKNSFGAVVPGRYIMSDTVSGDTAALWNKHCANQSIQDFSYARQAI
jgi:hypothetical protein